MKVSIVSQEGPPRFSVCMRTVRPDEDEQEWEVEGLPHAMQHLVMRGR